LKEIENIRKHQKNDVCMNSIKRFFCI